MCMAFGLCNCGFYTVSILVTHNLFFKILAAPVKDLQ